MPANTSATPPDYPDVLGTITGGPRLNVDMVQCAFAVYPPSSAIGQPLEGLVLLQNACDKPIQVQVAVQLPRKDSQGNRMTLITPKDEIVVGLEAAESGLLHIPIVPHLPTQTSQGNIIGVRFQTKAPRNYKTIRHMHGGRAATALNMSPFRLNILREVGFTAKSPEPGILTANFNIIAGHVENVPSGAPRYETLWTVKELPNEQARYGALAAQAERFAGTLSRSRVFEPLTINTEQRFSKVGLPLHPGETVYITKTLTYVMEDGLDLEDGFHLKEGRWFHRLTGIVSDKYIIEDEDRLIAYLYTAVVHDAVRLGLHIVERTVKRNFGTPDEHVGYADEVVTALEGHAPIDLGHVYLPLVLSGVLLNEQIKAPKENLWTSLAEIKEAWRGRQRLAGSRFEMVSEMLEQFVAEAENHLHRSRVPRP